MKPPLFHIICEDNSLIAVQKPIGILVHRTSISEDTTFVLQILRDQIGQKIYPIHRLDRGTSGVLLFGKSSDAAKQLSIQFAERKIAKTYLAIIRGFLPKEGIIDYPLASSEGKEKKEAVSHFQLISQTELPFSVGKYPTSRYSLVKVHPKTGRTHQIRRHFSHIRHPIIGDKKHGDTKHNSYFSKELKITRMLLHALKLAFTHPTSGQEIELTAPIDPLFQQAIEILELKA